jgi:hypothetical protein
VSLAPAISSPSICRTVVPPTAVAAATVNDPEPDASGAAAAAAAGAGAAGGVNLVRKSSISHAPRPSVPT